MLTNQLTNLYIKLKNLDHEDIETIKDKEIDYENKRFLLEENSKFRLKIILKIVEVENK
tara:strand:- start:186 stop:362 length:177 start_codon:yes stop_codon:yes gene_type:complete